MSDFILLIISIIAILTIFALLFLAMSLPLYIGWNVLAFIFGIEPISFLWAFILTQVILAINHVIKF